MTRSQPASRPIVNRSPLISIVLPDSSPVRIVRRMSGITLAQRGPGFHGARGREDAARLGQRRLVRPVARRRRAQADGALAPLLHASADDDERADRDRAPEFDLEPLA